MSRTGSSGSCRCGSGRRRVGAAAVYPDVSGLEAAARAGSLAGAACREGRIVTGHLPTRSTIAPTASPRSPRPAPHTFPSRLRSTPHVDGRHINPGENSGNPLADAGRREAAGVGPRPIVQSTVSPLNPCDPTERHDGPRPGRGWRWQSPPASSDRPGRFRPRSPRPAARESHRRSREAGRSPSEWPSRRGAPSTTSPRERGPMAGPEGMAVRSDRPANGARRRGRSSVAGWPTEEGRDAARSLGTVTLKLRSASGNCMDGQIYRPQKGGLVGEGLAARPREPRISLAKSSFRIPCGVWAAPSVERSPAPITDRRNRGAWIVSPTGRSRDRRAMERAAWATAETSSVGDERAGRRRGRGRPRGRALLETSSPEVLEAPANGLLRAISSGQEEGDLGPGARARSRSIRSARVLVTRMNPADLRRRGDGPERMGQDRESPSTTASSLSIPPIRVEVPAATTIASANGSVSAAGGRGSASLATRSVTIGSVRPRLNRDAAGEDHPAGYRSGAHESPTRRDPCRCSGRRPRPRSSSRHRGTRLPGGFLALLDDANPELFAGQDAGLHRVRQELTFSSRDTLQLGHPV